MKHDMLGGDNKRLESIQVLRAVAALLVIFYHISLVEAYRLDPTPIYPFMAAFEYFGYGGVNLFFVISGFIMYRITRSHWFDKTHWLTFVSRRLWRVYPIYCVSFLSALVVMTFLGWRARCLDDPERAFSIVFLMPGAGKNCVVPQAWTLHWEMYFYLSLSVVFLVPRRWFIILASIWLMASLFLTVVPDLGDHPNRWGGYNLHFVLGALAAWLLARSQPKAPLFFVLLGCFWFAASGWLNAQGILETKNIMHRVIEFGIGSTLIVYGLVGLEQRGATFSRLLVFLGDASFSLYLTHLIVFSIIRSVTAGMPHGPVAHTLWVATMFVSAIGFGILVYIAVERPVMRMPVRRPTYAPAEQPSPKQRIGTEQLASAGRS